GLQGPEGKGVKGAAVLDDGTLELTLSDDSKVRAGGNAKGPKGADGAPGRDGAAGSAGPQGLQGPEGKGVKGAAVLDDGTLELTLSDDSKVTAAGKTKGLACWDLNGNGAADLTTEDQDRNGTVDVNDCRGANGKDGAQGRDGITEYELVPPVSLTVPAGSVAEGYVPCPNPKKALGGGWSNEYNDVYLLSAVLGTDRYTVKARNMGSTSATISIHIVCARAG
ncbi:MAG TPA: hypothetical protein VLH75_14190, partial [Longimicrobiales bacterium]|nr:hypothetical protein [Longimicrobiales bacterium]